MNREILITGGRPTGKFHLGHYVGAFKKFIDLQQNYDSYFVLSDIHMLTTAATRKAIEDIWNNALNMILDLIAMGVEPSNTKFYLQSNIPEMPYYYTLIQNFIDIKNIQNTPSLMNTINEMKDNANLSGVSLGLLAYPVMEAADVMLLNADIVSVGRDNIDHIEIAKLIIEKINEESSIPLKLPRWISTEHNNILGTDGRRKMSKSLKNCIFISDSTDEVAEKVRAMNWDPINYEQNIVIKFLEIFSPETLSNKYLKENFYRNNENALKDLLIEVIEMLLKKMRERIKAYRENQDELIKLLILGTEEVREIANASLNKLKRGLGYNQEYCI